MAWTKTKTAVTVGVAVGLLAATAIVVKLAFFPAVADRYFLINQARLRQVPANVVVVRRTHFARGSGKFSPREGVVGANVNGAVRLVGRDVTFQQLIAVAYGSNLARVALPLNPPKDHFDFLVTVPKNPTGSLQLAIRKKLGYTAQREMRDTDVLALKATDPDSPGLQVSAAGRQNISERNGRLYLTHMQMSTLANLLEQIVRTPVVDKTGLTSYYDFSLAWDPQTARKIQAGTLDEETGKRILAEWGLTLEPDTASIEMLVVKKAG